MHWYSSWDTPRLAAYGFPDATAVRLDLCVDAMAFFFVFDDQFDGPLGVPCRDGGAHRHAPSFTTITGLT